MLRHWPALLVVVRSKKRTTPIPPKTGWPPGLLQDDSSELSRWFASRLDARETLRKFIRDENNRIHERQLSSVCATEDEVDLGRG